MYGVNMASSMPLLVGLFSFDFIVVASICFLISVIIFHICAIKHGVIATLISKSVSSIIFVCVGAFVLSHAPYFNGWESYGIFSGTAMYIFVFLGLVFGCLGDILLVFRKIFPDKRTKYIAAGMAAFALGHIFYAVNAYYYILNYTSDDHLLSSVALLIAPFLLSAAIAFENQSLAPRLNIEYGKLKTHVLLYSFIIAFLLISTYVGSIMAYVSSKDCIWLLPLIPISLFTISDFVLSTNYFDKDQKPMTPKQVVIIHVTYYLAQYLFALACANPLWTLVKSDEAEHPEAAQIEAAPAAENPADSVVNTHAEVP